jgi:hypothetical protein
MSDEFTPFLWMRWAHEHALWEMISVLLLVFGGALTWVFLFWPKRRVRNLNFFITRERDESNYPLKLNVEIRNFTGRNLLISGAYFVYAGLRCDPKARGDSPSGEHEIKFPPNPAGGMLSEVEYLLRHKEFVSTWIPIDPKHTNDEVDAAIAPCRWYLRYWHARRRAGKLYCMCTWLQDKPTVHKLVRRI